MDRLYVDGGVIRKNPSPFGGTWAWVLVDDADAAVKSDCGLIHPSEKFPTISNNYSELFAAIRALSYMTEGWQGTIHTDSLVTLHRIRSGTGFRGIPKWLREQATKLRAGRKWKSVLLAGHPTKADLIRGYKTKNRERHPVSRWNVWCDQQCQRLAREFFTEKQ